jgi:phosphomannomutase/phosphoglucomutase
VLNPSIFREYDIRGVADLELRDVDVELLGRAAGTFLRRHGGDRVNLGRDCRLSSERLRNACGLNAYRLKAGRLGSRLKVA